MIEMLYAMECMGELDTKQSKINNFITLLANSDTPNDTDEQLYLMGVVGLLPTDLTMLDRQYIENEVNKRL